MGPGHRNQPRPTPTQLEGVEGEEGAREPQRALNTSQPARPYAEVLTVLAMVGTTIDLYSSTSYMYLLSTEA